MVTQKETFNIIYLGQNKSDNIILPFFSIFSEWNGWIVI
jgi:hypothetical protein